MSSWKILNAVLIIGCVIFIILAKRHQKEKRKDQEESENLFTDNLND